jgi:hypothetical protein
MVPETGSIKVYYDIYRRLSAVPGLLPPASECYMQTETFMCSVYYAMYTNTIMKGRNSSFDLEYQCVRCDVAVHCWEREREREVFCEEVARVWNGSIQERSAMTLEGLILGERQNETCHRRQIEIRSQWGHSAWWTGGGGGTECQTVKLTGLEE